MEVDEIALFLIIFLFALLLISLYSFLRYSGMFLDVEVKTIKPPFGSVEIAYKYFKTEYRDCQGLYTEAQSVDHKFRCLVIYYDCPTECSGRIRFCIGIVLNDKDNEASEEERKRIKSLGYQIITLPEVEYVVCATFPNKTFLSLLIAVNKGIPKFRKYVATLELEAFPLLEIFYKNEIMYVAPLSKQDEFFVPEAIIESEDEHSRLRHTEDTDDDISVKDDMQSDTISSLDSLIENQSRADDAPSLELIDSLENGNRGMTNGSEASTESFEELQLDSQLDS